MDILWWNDTSTYKDIIKDIRRWGLMWWLHKVQVRDLVCLAIHFMATIICKWTLWSHNVGDEPWRHNCANIEAIIMWVGQWSWKPWWWRHWGHHKASLEILLEEVIDQLWPCTWRPRGCELWNDLQDSNQSNLEIKMKAVDLDGGKIRNGIPFCVSLVIPEMLRVVFNQIPHDVGNERCETC